VTFENGDGAFLYKPVLKSVLTEICFDMRFFHYKELYP